MKTKVLILCTGNSCRSQMAEGFLKSFDDLVEVYSAGTAPAEKVNPYAIRIMMEAGIDISRNSPQNVDLFLNDSFDYVITVCNNAKETCPLFSGKVSHRLHIGFDDPAEATGSEVEILAAFRSVRDKIKEDFYNFYVENIKTVEGEKL